MDYPDLEPGARASKKAMAANGPARDPESCKIIWWISISVTLAACCFVAVIVVGVVIAKPVVETDSLSFQAANCTTFKIYWTGHVCFVSSENVWQNWHEQYVNARHSQGCARRNYVVCTPATSDRFTVCRPYSHVLLTYGKTPGCNCGKNCHSWYPCYRYLVQYVPASGGNGTARQAVMFDTEGGLNTGRAAGEDLQCATRPCDRDHGKDAFASFNATYGVGQTYNCLYNPKDPDFVILGRLFSWDAMFHGMLWPSIGFAIFAVLTVYWIVRLKKTAASSPDSTTTLPGNIDQPTQYSGFTYK
ncbi:calcium-activated potassium channel subunit [Branchiostoma belcheri]|nr:calcium-activated potassium channel subunit [Branchiostoma belcheri]